MKRADRMSSRATEAPAVRVPEQRPKPEPTRQPATTPVPAAERGIGEWLDGLAEFGHRRLTGDYEVDEFGFDRECTERVLLPAARALYQYWFRVEAYGARHIPRSGSALLVANHSGTIPWDTVMSSVAVHEQTDGARYPRVLASGSLFATGVFGPLARKFGQTLACLPDAERLLRAGELVAAWPEGAAGLGKPFGQRYRVRRFTHDPALAAAIRTGTPIIPVAILGAEEIHPKLGELGWLARLLGLPSFPITPTFPLLGPLGAVPMPTKWRIEFGEPIRTDTGGSPAALAERVRTDIQGKLDGMLDARGNPFTG